MRAHAATVRGPARSVAAAIALLLSAVAAARAAERPEPPALLLAAGRVLSADGSRWLVKHDVLVTAGRIAAVGPAGSLSTPAGTQRVDLADLALVPGLIDLHTHLLLHPYDEASWDDQVLREQLELRTIRGVVAARATIEAGFTTIRDLGTEGAGFADVALRDAIAQGLVPGPRVLATTRAIVATGTYGPQGFDPRWSVPQGAEEADGVAGVRAAVRRQIAAGADWIKVYADYRRRPGAPATPSFSLEELAAMVDEARTAGVQVVAHATTDAGARRAAEAGVATIEHGTGISAAGFDELRERGVALCPTLAAGEAMARYGGWKPGQPEPARLGGAHQMMKLALASGVTIANGSDAGVFAHGDNARELELMAAYGMKPDAVLRAATSVAAQVLGRAEDLGRIAPGAFADLIAVAGDPLTDVAALRRPVLVWKEGALVIDRRSVVGAAVPGRPSS